MSPSALIPTEPIAGYTLQQRIGAGGYGEVWRAEAPGGLAKAVKFVYGRLDERRAACELKALNRVKEVRHPFLLSLERIEVVDGQLIIITELAEMSLKDRWLQCTEAGRTGIAREELLIYLRDAADALDYMSQSYSLQHLDVKPENLLIVGGRVKVADFGLVKDIDEATVSLMGGLTPVYAPPEVIEGRPSRHSDQYSLAIVYQEMLTGVLPFPGRTAAQLASQHLHTRPQLGALIPADRPAIARALAKNPAERFPDCRGLVDRLLQSTPPASPKCSVAPGFAQDIAPAPLEPREDAVDASPQDEQPSAGVLSAILATPAGGQTLALDDFPPGVEPSDAARSDVERSDVLPSDAERSDGEPSDAGLLADLPPAIALTRRPMIITQTRLLPPIDVAPGETRLRPTLVLGIGGVAARTLRRLRQRLADRFGDLTAVPALRMLLLDTDQKNLSQATQGNGRLALGSHEILAMPLRRRQDYRNDSERLLQWMSRRWLYNIPRSLQTGGLRPLGRLALVDHAEALFARLRQTLIAMTAPEALAVSAEKTGMSFCGEAPRVFVVASISGGTGSGMVIDVAYALRKILADLGHSDQGLCGILTHSTGRESTARDLAAVNAYACLSELHHFIVAGYPGDPTLRLPPSQHAAGAFNDTYVLNLGDEIDEAACDAATDVVAQYVYLNAVTAGGGFFDACRRSARRRPAGRPSDVAIRSFGLCQLGCTHSSIPATATELLCRTVVDRWRSEAETVVARDAATVSRSEVAKTPAGEPAVGESGVFEDPAAEPPGEFQLSLDQLAGQAREVLREQMGVEAESCYHSAVKQARAAGASAASEEVGEPSPARLLHAINVVLGAVGAENELSYAPAASLPHALASHLRKLAARQGATICDWIVGLVDSSGEGVRGARHATAWIAERLRSLDDEAGARLADLKTCLTQFEQILLQGPPQHVPRRSWLRLGRARRVASSLERQWTEYCQMRLDQLVLGETSTLMRSIRSQVSAVAEKLTGLGLELKLLADEFDVPESWGNRPGDDGQPADAVGELQSAVAESLWSRIPDLAARLDRQFRGEYFGRRGRREQTGQEEACCEPFAEVLRSAARAAVIEALRQIKVSDLFRSPDAPAHASHARPAYGDDGQARPARRSMQPFLEAAAPKVSADAAEARLLLVCPEGSDAKMVRELAGMNAIEPPSVVFDRDGDLVLCNEVEQASLASVAAHLIDHRSDYAEVAARLHSRVDVTWSSMPRTP